MAAKLSKNTDSKAKKFTAKEYNYDDGADPKDLLNDIKPTKRKLFHS